MSDEQVHEYLRSRAQGTPPADLVDGISRAVAGTPQHGHSWVASLLPVAAAAGLAAAVLVTALVIGEDDEVGPNPTPSPSVVASPKASVTAEQTPAPTTEAEPADLADVGATTTIPSQDQSGPWGTILIERLPDLGGLREIAADQVDLDEADPDPSTLYFVNDPDTFYLQLAVEYRADREPEPLRFGADDWLLVAGTETIAPMDDSDTLLGMPANYASPAIVIVGDTFSGTLVFAVPRPLAEAELTLAYQPASHDQAAWTALVRRPGTPPDTFVMAPPEPIAYVERPGLPITVAASEEADGLFVAPDTCTNPVAGYTVSYPDDWYTNTEIGPWPACSWFSPTFFEVEDPEVVPDEVVITIHFRPDSGPFGGLSVAVAGGSIEIDGRPTNRVEFVGVGGGFIDIGSFAYQYLVAMEGQLPQDGETGDTLIASASWAVEDDPGAYRLATAVLDRIMATLTFDE